MPLLSCITTTYDDGPLLMTSIDSVLGQSFEDFEYIIVDDGSGPATRAILEGLDDPRISIVFQANDGLSGARNKGLEQVTGDYVCFLDADDSRPGWAFEAIAGVIARDDPDLVLCRGALSEIRDEPMPFYDTPRFDEIAQLCPSGTVAAQDTQAALAWPLAQLLEPQSANKVVRSALLKQAGLGFPNTHFFEDVFFHTNALAAARRISFVHTPCFGYFRRYLRPQITSGSGTRRFDIIAVTRLTLETFARAPQFHDPLHRAAVLCACLKLLSWCGETIGHSHRGHFRQLTRAMLRLIDPLYLQIPDATFETLSIPAPLRERVEELARAG